MTHPEDPTEPTRIDLCAMLIAEVCERGNHAFLPATILFKLTALTDSYESALAAVQAENARLRSAQITAAVDAMPEGTTLIATSAFDALRAENVWLKEFRNTRLAELDKQYIALRASRDALALDAELGRAIRWSNRFGEASLTTILLGYRSSLLSADAARSAAPSTETDNG